MLQPAIDTEVPVYAFSFNSGCLVQQTLKASLVKIKLNNNHQLQWRNIMFFNNV